MPAKLIETSLWTWEGIPDEFLNLCLQRSILGVEAYLPGALVFTSAKLGVASNELSEKIHNPSKFASKSMVASIYHHMPAAVHNELSLRHVNQALYERTVAFYREVRNPIFHGKQLSNINIENLRIAFLHIAQLYKWIDSWCDPSKMFRSEVRLGPIALHIPINFFNSPNN